MNEREAKMFAALKVITTDPNIVWFLLRNDPKALEQAVDAIREPNVRTIGHRIMEQYSETFRKLAESESKDRKKEMVDLLKVFVRAADGEEIPEMEWGHVIKEARNFIE